MTLLLICTNLGPREHCVNFAVFVALCACVCERERHTQNERERDVCLYVKKYLRGEF